MNRQEIIYVKGQRKENPNFKRMKKFSNKLLIMDQEIDFIEMYKADNENGMIASRPTDPQYLYNKYINTRTKLPTETRLEIDNLPREKAEEIIIQTGIKLQKDNYHFCIFSCEGGRSPHLIIYDLDELEAMSPYKRFMAQVLFWRQVMPFGTFQHADTGILHDGHYVPLEFSNHWRHGTTFDLVLEYLPKQEDFKCKA